MALLRSAHLDTMYQELPLPERFQAARDDGFDAVELWSWQGRDLPALRAAADRAGIPVCCCDGDGPFSLIDPGQRADYLAFLARSLEAARTLGARGRHCPRRRSGRYRRGDPPPGPACLPR